MKNILVALDANDDSKILVDKAIQLAEKFDSKIWLLHVAAPEPDFVGYEPGPQFTRDERADELRREHIWIQKLADIVQSKNIPCEGLLVQGSTVAAIIEEAARLEADIIALAYHEHGFLHESWYGDNTDAIIRKSPIPVFVVPIKAQD